MYYNTPKMTSIQLSTHKEGFLLPGLRLHGVAHCTCAEGFLQLTPAMHCLKNSAPNIKKVQTLCSLHVRLYFYHEYLSVNNTHQTTS